MKKGFNILYLMAILLSSVDAFAQPAIDEIDPQRGLYIDNFVTWTSGSYTGGPLQVDPVHSILGVDEDHDGIFEKEEAVLEYCSSHHITSIVLLDLHKVFARNILMWNQNDARNEDLEEHLCRFMHEARTNHCITEIVAAGQSSAFFHKAESFMNQFLTPSATFRFSSAQLSNPNLSPNLLIAQDSSLVLGDSLYPLREITKFYLRAALFGFQCGERFNKLHVEYEFWQDQYDDLLTAATANWNPPLNIAYCPCDDPYQMGINQYKQTGCATQCGLHVYPSFQQAKFDLVFIPVINAIRSIKKIVNSGLSFSDPNYLKTETYLHSFQGLVNYNSDFTLFMDGNPDISTQNSMSNKDKTLFDLNHTTGDPASSNPSPDFSMLPNVERPLFAEFNPFRNGTNTPSNLDYNVLEYRYTALVPPSSWIQNNTDVHPLLSAESVADNGYDDYWGWWFRQTPENNLFETERQMYDNWAALNGNNIATLNGGNALLKNDIHRGGFLWYAQSLLVEANHHDPLLFQQFPTKTHIFKCDQPFCSPTGNAINVAIHYIGPSESSDPQSNQNQVKIEFWLTDCNGNNVAGQPTAASPAISRTYDAINYFVNAYSYAAPDINLSLLPTAPNCDYVGHMRLTYNQGCSYEYQENIKVQGSPTITSLGNTTFCEGNNTILRANLVDLGGTYNWYKDNMQLPNEHNRELTVTTSGEFYCELIPPLVGATNCSGMTNHITVVVHPNPHVSITRICGGGATTILSADYNYDPLPGSQYGPGGVTYQWSTGETTDRISVPLTATGVLYLVTVTSPDGCVSEDRKSISSDETSSGGITLQSYINASTSCSSNGVASILVNQTAPFHVQLSDGVNLTNVNYIVGPGYPINNLSPGSYTVYSNYSFGSCVAQLPFSIGPAPAAITANISTTDATCTVLGQIAVSNIVGPSATYTIKIPLLNYILNNATGATILNVPAGNYVVRIEEAGGGCAFVDYPVVINSPTPVSLTMSTTGITCNGVLGTATVTAFGGTGSFTYVWQNGATTSTISNLQAGSYAVTVSSGGCTASSFANVSTPVSINLSASYINPCFGQSNGSIHVSPLHGQYPFTVNSPWTFNPNNGNGYFEITNASAGSYTLSMTDANGCTATGTFDLTTGLSVSSNVTQASCGLSNGGIAVTASNGNAPYTYNWGVQGTFHSIYNLSPGNYTCIVTDNSNCTASITSAIINNPNLSLTASVVPFCSYSTTTSVMVSAQGGTGSYSGDIGMLLNQPTNIGNITYHVTDGTCSGNVIVSFTSLPPVAFVNNYQTNSNCNTDVTVIPSGGSGYYQPIQNNLLNLTPGSVINLSVADNLGCTLPPQNFVIPGFTASISVANNLATATPNLGTPQYTYSWSTSPPQSTSTTTALAPGVYVVTITDANGCTATNSVTIPGNGCNNFAASSISTPILCFGGNSTITVTGSGGTLPYTGAGSFIVTAGAYNYTLTDANGCSASTSITVTQPSQVVASATSTPISCFGGNSTVTVSGIGGTGSYTGTGTFTVGANTYNYTVTDANGCSASTSITVTQPSQVVASVSSTPISCFGGSSTITVSATGGTGPYTGTGSLSVTAGPHTYTVTDANGCSASTSITLTQPSQVIASASATAIACFGGSSTITVSATGGTGAYTGTGTFSATAGTSTYMVTDANGCSSSTSITVTQPAQVVVSAIQGAAISCFGGITTVTVSATGGTGSYTGTGIFTGVFAGPHTYAVTDVNGCTASTTINVNQPAAMALSITNPNGLCYNTQICATPAGYSQYIWSPTNVNSRCINVQTAAIYTVTATNSAGCTASSTINLNGLSQACCGSFQPLVQSTFDINPGLNNQSYSLNTNIVLTHDFTLDHCNIEIGPGFSIDAAGHTLTIINGSNLFACSQMWRGVIASQSGGGVIAKNSSITDAQFGIQGNHGTTIDVDNCTFTNDYVGIYFSSVGSTGMASINGTVVRSNFNSSGLTGGFPGQSPTPQTKSLAGIVIENNTLITIGMGANADNEFSDMNLGIYATNSSVSIDHSIFRQIINYDTYSLPWGQPLGTAILSTGSSNNSLFINGHNSNVQDIVDCIRGVRSWGVSTICQFNSLWNCDYGIDVSYQNNCKSYIHNNMLSCNYFGILAVLNDFASTFSIYDNNIEVGSRTAIDGNYPYSIAMLLSDAGTKNLSRLVKNNQITLNEFARHGIYGNVIYGYNIDRNYVHFNDINNNQTGISLSKSELCTVNCNSVSGFGSSFTNSKQSAMWFQDSPENTISCNTVANTYTGVGFMGTCVGGIGNNIHSNDIGEHNIGLYYKGTSTRVDHQDFRGTSWYFDSYSIYGAWDENIVWAQTDKYIVDGNGPRFPNGQALTNHPFTDNNPLISQVWPTVFIRDDHGNDENCGHKLLPNDITCIIGVEGGDGGSDRRAARNLEGSQDFDEETKWKTREKLYEKLLNEPNYLDSDTVYVNFFQQMSGTYLEQIASLNKEKNELFLDQQSLLQTMEVRTAQINDNSELIRKCDSLIQIDTLPISIRDSLKLARYSIIQNTGALLNQNNASLTLIQTAIENKSDIMNADNAQINSIKIYEQNEKLVNEVYFQVVYKNKFENLSNYSAQILSVATQCPLSGGPSVYKARTLASLIDPQLRYDDEQACSQTGYSWRLSQRKSDAPFSIYPNPAFDKVNVHYLIEIDAKLAIYNEIGELVMLKFLPKNSKDLEIDLSLFKNGVYSCKLVQENQVDVKQLIVIH